MKGTYCGTRAVALVILLISFAALAPGVASADIAGGIGSTAAAVPVPAAAVPAAPSVPAVPVQVAAPVASLPTPVSKTTASKPSLAVTAPATRLAITPSSGDVQVKTPGAKAVKALGTVENKAIKVVNASAAKIAQRTQGVRQFGVKVTQIPSGIVLKLVPASKKQPSVVLKKKAGRLLANDYGNDWQGGCTQGTYTACQQTPVGPVDNRCYQSVPPVGDGTTSGTETTTGGTPPPFSPTEMVNFTQGTETTWTKTTNVYQNIAGVSTLVGVLVEMKTFLRGLYGTAPSGTIYRLGQDQSDQWSAFLPLSANFYLDKRQWTELLVQRGSGPAPSMWYSEHDVVKPGSITVQWRIVCNRGDKADDDQDQGQDHDRSGDYSKYKHHHENFNGYNDNEPSSYDQGD